MKKTTENIVNNDYCTEYGTHIWNTVIRTPLRVFWVGSRVLKDSRQAKVILDAGSGSGKTMRRLKECGLKAETVGLDIYLPSLKLCSHDHKVLASVEHLPFRPKVFDVALLYHIIEHLTKDGGLAALNGLSKVSRKILVATSYGFISQGRLNNNPYQVHRSGWMPEDFRKLGFKVRGFYGPRFLWSKSSFLTLRMVCAILGFPILYFKPELAFYIYCTKEMS